MKYPTSSFFVLFNVLFIPFIYTQDLDALLEENMKASAENEYVSGTFKATRLSNGHTVETEGKNELRFILGHRFDEISKGPYEMFGLDEASMRFGFDYGLTDFITIGFGRSTHLKTYDAHIKVKLFRQSKGKHNFPVSITVLSGASFVTVKDYFNAYNDDFEDKLSGFGQVIIARKFCDFFAVQLSPIYSATKFHPELNGEVNVLALGIGARLKLTNRIHFTTEYYSILSVNNNIDLLEPLSFGLDIETGGHVFQIFFSNSHAMFEKGYLNDIPGTWNDGNIYFGFNLNRVFNLSKKTRKMI